MADGSPEQWGGDFLGGNAPSSEGAMDRHDETAPEEPNHNQRPLQLPRVGWGTDDADDDGDDHDSNSSSSNSNVSSNSDQHPSESGVPPPSVNRDDGDGVVLRALSRNAEGDLASIPENMSMHGAWPDYYPDILGCYSDYDERKKYRYNRCGPNVRWRVCALIMAVFAAIIGSRVYTKMSSSKMAGKQGQPLQHSSNNDDDITLVTPPDTTDIENTDTDENDNHNPDANAQYPPDADIYQVIVDTLHPLMFDDDTEWDGTYFNAFEFCGTTYNRIPCPYIAYCPLGPGNAPLGGAKIEIDGSWAPIFNTSRTHGSEPDWVQLGKDDTCELYSRLYGNAPPWGNIAGQGDGNGPSTESITRHVMCCLESVDGTYKGGIEGMAERNDPDYIDRPPTLEEDEVEKPIPIPIREEEEGDKSKEQNSTNNSGIEEEEWFAQP